MRNGFSFVEVLVSIVILAYFGTVLLKFNSFNKRAMEHSLVENKNLLLLSPYLYIDKMETKLTAKAKSFTLYDVGNFKKLSDIDKKFLKKISFKVSYIQNGKKFLFSDAQTKKHYMIYGTLSLKAKEETQRFFWMREGQ